MADLVLSRFGAWTARDLVGDGQGYVYGPTRNFDLRGAELYPSRGFKVVRKIAASISAKPGGSWTHQDESGLQWPWYYCNTGLYNETGSDTPSAIASSLTAGWQFSAFNMASPCGTSGFFNGTNSEARALRIDTSLKAVLFDLAAPGQPTGSGIGTGGSWTTGNKYAIVTWVDKTGATVVESGPSAVSPAISITNPEQLRVNRPGSPPSRATHWRVYANETGTGTAYYYQGEATVATTEQDFTDFAQTTLLTSRNSVYRTSVMPLTGVDVCAVHSGRLFIASRTSNEIYWSERDQPNNWYSTNSLDSGAESHWNSPVQGMISVGEVLYVFTSNSIHRVFGDFSRDTAGENPTYAARAATDVLARGIGCVSHRAITDAGRGAIFFQSTEGPAVLSGNAVQLLSQDDIEDEYKRWDWDYMDRCSAAYDRVTGTWNLAVPRLVSAQRPQDGASSAGIPSLIYRHDGQRWHPPLAVEAVDLAVRAHTSSEGTADNPVEFMFVGPHGTLGQLNFGWSGGDADGDVSAATFDGKLASSSTTTSATWTQTGISDNALVGQLVVIRYPDDDTGFPAEIAVKTIVSNTTTGSALTVNWVGALTAPSSTEWTCRLAGWPHVLALRFLASGNLQKINNVEFIDRDVIGAESRA